MKVQSIVEDLLGAPPNHEVQIINSKIIESTEVKEVLEKVNQVSDKLSTLKSSFVTTRDPLTVEDNDIL